MRANAGIRRAFPRGTGVADDGSPRRIQALGRAVSGRAAAPRSEAGGVTERFSALVIPLEPVIHRKTQHLGIRCG